ncbi:hypothetical protein ACQY0O_003300 [Thecaphora frezii]
MTTAAGTRRSSRLSGASASESNDDSASISIPSASSAPAASKRTTRKSATASARSSGASSAVIPAIAARTSKRTTAASNERRLEDVLGGPGDQTRMQDMSLGAFVQVESSSRKGKSRSVTSSTLAEHELLDSDGEAKTQPASRVRKNGTTVTALTTSRPARAPRKTLGEEAEGDFVFQRDVVPTRSAPAPTHNGAAMPPPTISASAARKRRAASPSGSRPTGSSSSLARAAMTRSVVSRTTYEPLPDEAAGETPIIRRNQAFRAGLEVHPGTAVASSSNGGRRSSTGRRSSLGLKGERRRSSLRDPALAAYPHDDVPDHELFRHCPPDSTPQIRMRHLMGWALKRSLDAALGVTDPSRSASSSSGSSKGKRKRTEPAIPALTEAEKVELAARDEGIRRVLDKLLSDLHCGAFSINWMGENEPSTGASKLLPHPRNVSNLEAKSRLSATVDSMTNESSQWQKELWQIEAYEAGTVELEQQLAALNGDTAKEADSEAADDDSTELPEVEWNAEEDLTEAGQQQLEDAQRALAWSEKLLSGNLDVATDAKTKAAPTKSKGRGRVSKAAAAAAEAEEEAAAQEVLGSEQDARWKEVEFNVDLLRHHSHRFARLEQLASRYVRTVSAHNAQALRNRTSTSSSYVNAAARGKQAAASVRGAAAGEEAVDDSTTDVGGAERLENLLSGIRESRPETAAGAEQADPARRSESSEAAPDRFDPDESDAMDLLRALARP